MCGFIVHKTGSKINANKIRKRGPDYMNRFRKKDFVFEHHLLSITGEFTLQPFFEDNIVCVFNGEIYNLPYEKSDGENIIPYYKKYGPTFARHFDGEFAIALYDFENHTAVFVTDQFGTKPLWVKGNECASYVSGLGGKQQHPNTIVIRNMKTQKDVAVELYEFYFDNQYKKTFDDWNIAFEKAVRKRAYDPCFIGLSSGYDSGAIACELLKSDTVFRAYSILAEENKQVIDDRAALLGSRHTWLKLSQSQYNLNRALLGLECEPYTYDIHGRKSDMFNDKGAIGLAEVCRQAKIDGHRVYLSGQGSDEILADYALYPGQSDFKGRFPKKLKPWRNFWGSCQKSYIAKEEFVAGMFGIETRYPFLDKYLVQEFLYLHPDLKNLRYKAPLHDYFLRNRFPFDPGVKVGFRANKNLA